MMAMSPRAHPSPVPAQQETPLVSIIVPTYNEARDIRRTLEALVALRYPAKEILVVDDSTDETPRIVETFAVRGVRLCRGPCRGRCEARNAGIRLARGDIVVILNADVFPEPDFLERIVAHYRDGADYVLVESRVANTEDLIPRYLEAWHRLAYDGQDWIEWTEGWSCRRAAAIEIGLFPETPLPLCAGEDGYFGLRLAKRYRKVIDRSIVVPHMAPARLAEFWAQQTGRGRATPRYRLFIDGQPRLASALAAAAKTCRAAVTFAVLVPPALTSLRLCRYSPRGLRDFFPFIWVLGLQQAAQISGEWAGVFDILRYRAPRRPEEPLSAR